MSTQRTLGGTVIRIVLWSLVIGLALSVLPISPQDLLAGLGDTAASVFETAVGVVAWAVPYILIGAAVVVPIWLVLTAWRAMRGRGG